MKRLLITTLGLLCCATGFLRADDKPLFEDKVLVKGDGFEIKQSQLDQAFTQRKAMLAGMGRSIPDPARDAVEKETLDLLILKNLLLKRASADDKAMATKDVETQLKQAPKDALDSQAKLLGLTVDALKTELIDQGTANQVVMREFKPKIVITDEMCRKFYNDNLSKFEQPEKVRAAHVLISTKGPDGKDLPPDQVKEKRATAEKVLARARKGEDFAALAKEFSDDPGSKDSGGEYTFGKGEMVPEFESTAFGQTPGTISDIVTTKYGFHIIKTIEKIPAKVAEFSDVEPKIKEYLGGKELQQQLQNLLETARKDPKLQILDDRFK